MLLQTLDWSRIMLVFIVQTFIVVVFIILSYKVLKRHRTRISMICSGIFIPIAAAFIVNLIYLPLRINPLVLILHIISIFLLFVGMIFILMFNLNLLKSKFEFTRKKQLILFIIYAIASFVILLIPGGITIDASTDWRPLYTLTFSIILMIFATVFLIVPSFLFTLKIYKTFEDETIKKKWLYYLLGYCGLAFVFNILIIYNTFTDPIIRTLFSIISVIILIPSGILMYLGIGRQLSK